MKSRLDAKLFFKTKLREEYFRKQDQLHAVSNELESLKAEYKAQDSRIVKQEVVVDNLEFERRKIESQIECNNDKIKSICSVYESIGKRIELLKKEYAEKQKQLEATKKEIEKLDK